MVNDFRVIRTDFWHLGEFLNSLEENFEEYYIYEIFSIGNFEFVIILCKKVI